MTTLPLVELHLHLEGTLEPDFIMRTAAKNGVSLPWESVEDLRSRYEFTDLQSFLDLYYTNLEVLREREDFRDMTDAYLRRAQQAGVRHAEVSVDVQVHTARGIPVEVVLGGIRDALDESEARYGISTMLLVAFVRNHPPEEAQELLDHLLRTGARIDGIGLDSTEVGYPPRLFAGVYETARRAGLRLVAHAGEEGPPEYVVEALDLLQVERVDHGNRSLEDDALVDRMVRERIPLTVCPLSNVRLRVVDRMAVHPLPGMLARGLRVSVNSDDPAYFGGYIDDNVDSIRGELALTDDQLETLARNAVDSAFITDDRRRVLHAEIDEWAAQRGGPQSAN
ncbi:adenosine deaminase [Microbacterium sp. cx-59]|uniref:adenosine deaminase n=1 Tax=Microbacterium sp. cx-59 TaxID=2891207 RepID=UPI001E376A63|nr:adenosine deaminase [Microbacterium sp. cx-59]MCC4907887.1 adenosine deaminase [Microbacterium sp. cx-59]